MKLLKTLGLMFIVSAFLLAFSAVGSYAQPGKARWGGNQGKHKGWSKGNHYGWNKGRKTGWNRRYNRSYWWGGRRVTYWQYVTLRRIRYRY
jgi:hypothetical protein